MRGEIENIPSEGSLYPDTYFFLRNENKKDLIIRMQTRMTNIVNSIWAKDKNNSNNLNSKKDLIKLASIIEAEAKHEYEKNIISSVFHNRIIKGMRLQSDPTILYYKNIIANEKTRKIYKKDLISDNPWNTYTRKGFPITPICNPGEKSLEAAMFPKKTKYLYFVSNGEGGIDLY